MAKTLYEYYREQGSNLPSVDERRKMYNLGDDYRGTAQQNTALLARLSSGEIPSNYTPANRAEYYGGSASTPGSFTRATQRSSQGTQQQTQNQPGYYGQGANQFRMATEDEKEKYQQQQQAPQMQTYERAIQEQQGPVVSSATATRGEGANVPTPTPTSVPEPGKKMDPDSFFQAIAPSAYKIQEETGVPAKLIMAQAAVESGWGEHAPGYNYFGIKGEGPAGSQLLWTKEVINGQEVPVQAYFRVYHNPQEAFEDHAKLLSTNQRYKNVIEAGKTGDVNAIARAIGQSGYATDPNYSSTILSAMRDYGMEKYEPAPTPTPTPTQMPFANTRQAGVSARLNNQKTEPTMWERIKKILGWEE